MMTTGVVPLGTISNVRNVAEIGITAVHSTVITPDPSQHHDQLANEDRAAEDCAEDKYG